ncbi:MAG: hypothetical protein B7733_13475 [Myxococcales bacterium FL481]|nr:MAG: hypothetical protein B7733_13475 [Myxococcales bacterium FL481]
MPGHRRLLSGLALAVGVSAGGVSSPVHASVTGSQGIEIEGARDRRGLYLGPGLLFGAQFPAEDGFMPGVAGTFHIGGGVNQRLLLGGNFGLVRYFAPHQSLGLLGDLEATGFVWRGFYLRAGLGVAAVPTDDSLSAAMGGNVGGGYELWVNQTVAMDLGARYDLRAVPGDPVDARHSVLLGARFTWY